MVIDKKPDCNSLVVSASTVNILIFCISILSFQRGADASCSFRDGQVGECVKFEECRSAVIESQKGVNPGFCNLEEGTVCCPDYKGTQRERRPSRKWSPHSSGLGGSTTKVQDAYADDSNFQRKKHSVGLDNTGHNYGKKKTNADIIEEPYKFETPNSFYSDVEVTNKPGRRPSRPKNDQNEDGYFVPPGQAKKKPWRDEKTTENDFYYEQVTKKPNRGSNRKGGNKHTDSTYESNNSRKWGDVSTTRRPEWSDQGGRRTTGSWYDGESEYENSYNNQRTTPKRSHWEQETYTSTKRPDYYNAGNNYAENGDEYYNLKPTGRPSNPSNYNPNRPNNQHGSQSQGTKRPYQHQSSNSNFEGNRPSYQQGSQNQGTKRPYQHQNSNSNFGGNRPSYQQGSQNQGNKGPSHQGQGSNFESNRPNHQQGSNFGGVRPSYQQGSNFEVNRPSYQQGFNFGSNGPNYQQGSSSQGLRPSYQQGNNFESNSPSYQQGSNFGSNSPSYQQGSNFGSNSPSYQQGSNFGSNSPSYQQGSNFGSNRPNYQQGFNPEGNPGSRPGTQKRKRISEQKCDEYSKQVIENITGLPLTTNPDPVIIPIRKCITPQQLIVGGENTTLGEFPHMAAIGFRDKNKKQIAWNCGGSLISDQFVMTAAHCTSTSSGRPIKVRLGEYNLMKNDDGAYPVDYGIAEIITHPEYRPPSKYHDIALLKLTRKVTFFKHIRPACLYAEDSFSASKAIATGWGRIYYDGGPSEVLQKVVLSIVDNNTCNRLYKVNVKTEVLSRGIVDSQLCAGELTGGKDTCQGDSGGPLSITSSKCIHHIIGVTSFGKSCALPNSSGVYTRVSAYVPWIESVVWPTGYE